MNKNDAVKHLRSAKSSHIMWRSYAQALVAGIPMDESKIPVIHTDCKFGTWYYGQGQTFSPLVSYSAIEVPHEMLHSIYHKIYNALNRKEENEKKKGFFSKFKASSNEKSEIKLEVEAHLHNLIEMSKTLLNSLELLEKEIMSLSDEELAALI